MAIQLRIRHSQGEQVIALSSRTLNDPLVVGRDEEADVVVPSADVSRRHCALFVHDRKWMIQDTGSRLGTFVAGERVTQPRMLNIGDEITLGPASVVMSVEPLSISAPAPPPPAPVEEESTQESSEEESSEENGDEAAFDAAAVSTPTTHFYVPKKKPMSGAVVGVTIGVIVVLVGVAIWAVMGVKEKQEAAQTPVVVAPAKPAEPKSIFDFPEQNKPAAKTTVVAPTPTKTSDPGPAPRPAVVRTPTPPPAPVEQLDPMVEGMTRPGPVTATKDPDPVEPTPPPAPTPTAPAADIPSADNALRSSPEWQRVEVAHRTAAPAEAIWVFMSYLTEHPDTPFKSDLDSFSDNAFDRLWWYRIKELCEQVAVVKKNLAKIDKDIAVETNAKMKKQFQADRKTVDKDLQEKLATLTEMNYDSLDPPDVYDDARLAELRPKRDAEYYEKWKKARLSSIKYTRGRSAF